jgi:hypothetical protein
VTQVVKLIITKSKQKSTKHLAQIPCSLNRSNCTLKNPSNTNLTPLFKTLAVNCGDSRRGRREEVEKRKSSYITTLQADKQFSGCWEITGSRRREMSFKHLATKIQLRVSEKEHCQDNSS